MHVHTLQMGPGAQPPLILDATFTPLHLKSGAPPVHTSAEIWDLWHRTLYNLNDTSAKCGGWERAGAMRLESILLGKGAMSVVVMPDSMFLGHRYSRTAPPFRFPLPVDIAHTSKHGAPQSDTCKWIYIAEMAVWWGLSSMVWRIKDGWVQAERCCWTNEEWVTYT